MDSTRLLAILRGDEALPSSDPAADLFTRVAAFAATATSAARHEFNASIVDVVGALHPSLDSVELFVDALRVLSILRPQGGQEVIARLLRSGEIASLRIHDEPVEALALLVLAEYGFPAWASSWGVTRLADIARAEPEPAAAAYSLAAALAQTESLAYSPRLDVALLALARHYEPRRKFGSQTSEAILSDTLQTLLIRHCSESLFHILCESFLDELSQLEPKRLAAFRRVLYSTLVEWNTQDDYWKLAILTALSPSSDYVPSTAMAQLKKRSPAVYNRAILSASRLAESTGVDFDARVFQATAEMIHTGLASSRLT